MGWLHAAIGDCTYSICLRCKQLHGKFGDRFLHGLRLVAVAIVAQAIWGMARTLVPGPQTGDHRDGRCT